jgi:3'-5' exoribonuclease
MTIAELTEDRVVEGIYAVRMKRKLRTKSGAAYLALELVDATGRIEARVWNDVELLDGRFEEGDAVRVLARVESSATGCNSTSARSSRPTWTRRR